jgi:hypothetical protein
MLRTSVIVKNLKRNQIHSSAVRMSSSGSVNNETYTEKQAKLGRPVSPHVEIYKFPPAALSSIANRITGVALSAGILVWESIIYIPISNFI